MRGVRIQSIVNELNGEKIDVVEWSPDPATFIANALSPAQVSKVLLDERGDGKTATVIVPDGQLSLAIGREGQNARLAAKLTGWRIDIKSVSEAAEEMARREAEIEEKRDLLSLAEAILLGKEEAPAAVEEATPDMLEQVFDMPVEELGLSTRVYNVLAKAGISEVGQLMQKLVESESALLTIPGFGPKALDEVKKALQEKGLAPLAPEPAELPEEVAEEVAEAEVTPPAEAVEALEAEAVEAEVVDKEEEALTVAEPAEAEEEEAAAKVEEIPEAVVEAEAAEEAEAKVEEEVEPAEGWHLEEVEAEEVELAEEELEDLDFEDELEKKKKKRRKKRVYEYDETFGRVVTKRRRKPSRRRTTEWEDYLD